MAVRPIWKPASADEIRREASAANPNVLPFNASRRA
jgi:hypothetical protein